MSIIDVGEVVDDDREKVLPFILFGEVEAVLELVKMPITVGAAQLTVIEFEAAVNIPYPILIPVKVPIAVPLTLRVLLLKFFVELEVPPRFWIIVTAPDVARLVKVILFPVTTSAGVLGEVDD